MANFCVAVWLCLLSLFSCCFVCCVGIIVILIVTIAVPMVAFVFRFVVALEIIIWVH